MVTNRLAQIWRNTYQFMNERGHWNVNFVIQLIKPKDTWITIAQFMNMLHLIYSINFPYKLVKSYKAIKDQCGFLSHSNLKLYWQSEVSLLKDLNSHFFWFPNGMDGWLIHVSKLAYDFSIGSFMFQNLPTISR